MHFRYGLRFLLHSFLRELLRDVFNCAIRKLVSNSILHLNTFLAHHREKKLKPTPRFFFYMFKFQKSQTKGFYQVHRQDSQPELVITPSSNKGWHEEWIFIGGNEVCSLPPFVDPSSPEAPKLIKYKIHPGDSERY